MFYNLIALLAFLLPYSAALAGEDTAAPEDPLLDAPMIPKRHVREIPLVNIPEDEFILPPYLFRVEGSTTVNVTNKSGTKHASAAGEWLDVEQEIELQESLAIQVFMHEQLQWVGGGVLRLKTEEHLWKRPSSPYQIKLNRGVLAVWVNGKSTEQEIEITTPQEKFLARKASFWISVREGVTELYLIEGSLSDEKGREWKSKKYMSYRGEHDGVSIAWDAEAYKVRIAGLYPNLVKLIDLAQLDWEKGRVKKTYADARQKGWRNKLRK